MNNRNRRNNNNNSRRKHAEAWAPYNFVPLQATNQLLEAKSYHKDDNDNPIPKRHDIYDGHSGYFDVKLTTEALTFIRGMLTAEYVLERKKKDEKLEDNPDFFSIDGETPMIPGSSLHGMLRNLLEIVTFGKVHFVSASNPIFFRAVAADRTDPLKPPYEKIIGKFSRNVRAGYLMQKNGNWYIQPAEKIGQSYFAKVKDWNKKQRYSPVEGVNGLIRLDDTENYTVQYHDVAYDANGDFVSRVYTPDEGQYADGVLVCSGNMAETHGDNKTAKSPRKNYTLVARPNENAKILPISKQAINDYLRGLTAFQKEAPFDSNYGVLKAGRPVFYIDEGNHVLQFGHTPNFRVAVRILENGEFHAVTPLDRVPWQLRKERTITDWAEAMFGYVDGSQDTVAYAGRVSVTSAKVLAGQSDYYERTITPKILASPKVTTFQHYLEQQQGTDTPTHRLQHYGDDSTIRGHKLYWRQDVTDVSDIEGDNDPKKENVTTRITPLRDGVKFSFKVHFDNLSDEELGALAWVLTLDSIPDARHQIGMGKPFGMGVVKLVAQLNLIDRKNEDKYKNRYAKLFNAEGNWFTAEKEENISNDVLQGAIEDFKKAIEKATDTKFDQNERIQELKMMLIPVQPAKTFTYMQIEPENDYDGRPVLPRPSQVSK